MLKIVNLTKIYKVKGGVETRALDGVSLTFPETGMVFLLGKSGSGKSTLLNVCGGLDNPTSGEIIVKGRSSKDFTQGDFDSYRNTFIGFIFQEYNILNEFSVEDNIALALELQGKPKDKKAIDDLLEQVDLAGYAKRKPNTLSGGQKQRIAIARALIKSPEIIMADEPTGALDSNTGKQVFETLKKLSKDKLVIVVSHDRDFAEQYGDRIIELKDGKVLSDVSKGVEAQQTVGDGNVSVVGGSTLCVEDGDKLTEKDFKFIREFLAGQKGAIIASGEKEMEEFKRTNRITEDGEREVFVETDESKTPEKSYTKQESQFIRSKLPLKRAITIGVSSLKTKPIRLIFTILLCIVSFTMFGLFSTLMLYDAQATLKKSMRDSTSQYLLVEKEYQIRNYNVWNGEEDVYYWEQSARLTQADIDGQKGTFGRDGFGAVEANSSSIGNLSSSDSNGMLYQSPQIKYVASLPESNALRGALKAGNYPQAEDEVLVSEYLAQCIVKNGFNDGQYAPTDMENMIGKKIKIDLRETMNAPRGEYKIVGIFDSGYDRLLLDYPALAEKGSGYEAEQEELQMFSAQYGESLHGVIFVKQSLLDKIIATKKAQDAQNQNQNALQQMVDWSLQFSPTDRLSTYQYAKASRIPSKVGVIGSRTPQKGETVMTYSAFSSFISGGEGLEKERDSLVSIIKNEVEKQRKEVLREKGYTYALDGSNLPSSETAPEQYKLYEEYIFSKDRIYNEFIFNANSDWYFGRNLPQTEDGYYAFYNDVFLPVWTEGENSYKAQFEALVPIGERMLTIAVDGIGGIDTMEQNIYMWSQYLREGTYNYYDGNDWVNMPLDPTLKTRIANALLEAVKNDRLSGKVSVWNPNGGESMQVGEDRSFKIVGFIDLHQNWDNIIALDDETFTAMQTLSKQYGNTNSSTSWQETNYVEGEDAIFDVAFLPYDHSDAQTQALDVFSYEFSENDTRIILKNAIAQQVRSVNETAEDLSEVFMWIGIVMAVFSALLLSNFISVSITNKKKEIGILRAVGARGTDVFKIFFSESAAISLICVVISLIVSIVVCGVLNAEMGSMLAGVSLFVFGPVSVAILVGVALLTAMLATFLPVYLAAKKKPVESIRAL